jgi:hypothetical protein
MQEISLNPQKLAGQCSKLKCCLMYEYDAYADARRTIPRLREPLQTMEGEYYLIKIDPLAGTMSFSTSKNTIANLTTLPVSRVREIIAINRAGEKAETLLGSQEEKRVVEPTFRSEEDSITRFDNKSKRKKNKRNRGNRDERGEGDVNQREADVAETQTSAEPQPQEGGESEERRQRDNHRHHRHHDRNDRRERAEQGEKIEGSEEQQGENGGSERREHRDRRGDRRGRNHHHRAHRRDGQNRGGERNEGDK